MSDYVVEAEFPPKLLSVLFDEEHKYIVIPGGRGAGRSWGVARALLIRGVQKPLLILCAREYQSSIEDSVHRLLSNQIHLLHLEAFYQIGQKTITGINGTEFKFVGIRTNITGLKSFEGADICWVEEAEAVQEPSWRYLIPTIRKKDAQFFITFNPQLITDETYQRFVVNTPPRCIVQWLNYYDNPWFEEDTSLIEEMEHLKSIDEAQYRNVYLGEPKEYLEGAIFAPQIKQCVEEGRIGDYPHDASKVVDCYFDMGRDGTAIWMVQNHGVKRHLINYYENLGEAVDHYIDKLQDIAIKNKYRFGNYIIPHDGARRWWGSELSIYDVLEDRLGKGRIEQLPRVLEVEDRINSGRMIFPNCYFDEKNTLVGVQCLRSYRYKPGAMKPDHDHSSHGADAFTAMAMASQPKRNKFDYDRFKAKQITGGRKSNHSWMGR